MLYSLLAVLIWGSSFVAGKFAYSVADPVLTVQFRLIVAALIVSPGFAKEYRKIPKALRPRMWLIALLSFPVVYLLQFIGLKYTSASSAITIIGIEPILVVLAGYLFFRERASALDWLAGCAAFAGIVLVVLGGQDDGEAGLWGSLLVFAATLAFVFCLHFSKAVMRDMSARTFSVTTMVLGAILCLPFTPLLTQSWRITPNLPGVTALFYLAVICSWLAVVFWNKGLQRIPANLSGIIVALEPVFGVLLVVVMLGETPSALTWGGIVLALGATAVSVGYPLYRKK